MSNETHTISGTTPLIVPKKRLGKVEVYHRSQTSEQSHDDPYMENARSGIYHLKTFRKTRLLNHRHLTRILETSVGSVRSRLTNVFHSGWGFQPETRNVKTTKRGGLLPKLCEADLRANPRKRVALSGWMIFFSSPRIPKRCWVYQKNSLSFARGTI